MYIHGQLKSVLISTVLYNVFSFKLFMLKVRNLLTWAKIAIEFSKKHKIFLSRMEYL